MAHILAAWLDQSTSVDDTPPSAAFRDLYRRYFEWKKDAQGRLLLQTDQGDQGSLFWQPLPYDGACCSFIKPRYLLLWLVPRPSFGRNLVAMPKPSSSSGQRKVHRVHCA